MVHGISFKCTWHKAWRWLCGREKFPEKYFHFINSNVEIWNVHQSKQVHMQFQFWLNWFIDKVRNKSLVIKDKFDRQPNDEVELTATGARISSQSSRNKPAKRSIYAVRVKLKHEAGDEKLIRIRVGFSRNESGFCEQQIREFYGLI